MELFNFGKWINVKGGVCISKSLWASSIKRGDWCRWMQSFSSCDDDASLSHCWRSIGWTGTSRMPIIWLIGKLFYPRLLFSFHDGFQVCMLIIRIHKSLVIWQFPVYKVYTPRACIVFTSIIIDTWSGKERIWSCVNWWRDSCEYTLGASNIHSSQRLEEPLRTERSRFSSNSPMAKRKNQNDWQWLRK